MPVDKARLGSMVKIASGGFGTVYKLTSGFRLPGSPVDIAYKEAHAYLDAPVRDGALRGMEHAIAIRENLPPRERATLDRYTTWPLSMVTNGGRLVGVLMPLIPSDFFVDTAARGGMSGQVVLTWGHLCTPDVDLMQAGIDPPRGLDDPLVRLVLCQQLAYVMAKLHQHGAVYGDLSLANVAIAVDPPRVLLFDCDPVALESNPDRMQGETPFFFPPEVQAGQRLQDRKTDVYKLALCLVRGLQKGAGITQTYDPSPVAPVLGRDGVDLLTRAMSPDRDNRPTAKELCLFLEDRVFRGVNPPEIISVALSRSIALRGQDVVVTWTVRGADKIRIVATNGFEVVVHDPENHPRGYAIRPLNSGEIWVEATNRFDTTRGRAGTLELYDLPTFSLDSLRLPRLSLPEMTPVQVPSALLALPPRPLVTADTHPVPRPEMPDLGPLQDLTRAVLGSPSALLGDADPAGGGPQSLAYRWRELEEATTAALGEGTKAVAALAAATVRARQDVEDLIGEALAGISRDAPSAVEGLVTT